MDNNIEKELIENLDRINSILIKLQEDGLEIKIGFNMDREKDGFDLNNHKKLSIEISKTVFNSI